MFDNVTGVPSVTDSDQNFHQHSTHCTGVVDNANSMTKPNMVKYRVKDNGIWLQRQVALLL